MEQRVGFTLTDAQIEKACVVYVKDRLMADEECKARVYATGVPGDGAAVILCEIAVSKKRKPKERGSKKAPAAE